MIAVVLVATAWPASPSPLVAMAAHEIVSGQREDLKSDKAQCSYAEKPRWARLWET